MPVQKKSGNLLNAPRICLNGKKKSEILLVSNLHQPMNGLGNVNKMQKLTN